MTNCDEVFENGKVRSQGSWVENIYKIDNFNETLNEAKIGSVEYWLE